MKNYKGYNKTPYCNAHYPTTKFTAVADTPENRRLQQQTKNQSNLQYHAEHKKNLEKFTAVSDDPESRRLAKNTQQSSNVAYKAAAPPPSAASAPPPSMGYAPSQQYQPPRNETSYQPPRNEPSSYQPPPPQQVQPPPQQEPTPPPAPVSSSPAYVALYDYTAADDDEVDFKEGDIIINADIIDQGWMTGTVQRTGQSGMLPSNYVDPN
ncbi:LIM and SH3 domain protein 1-like [Lytechinus pictus]|uniref:LIM and SH3 domain protein 1-like n=1 Tax=Lytechinus pictus TaxID=7653 RepID=UPI00240DACFF|nr:LIM and SH3 domain protein 1-like [Lytechinus pictus]